MSTLFCDLDGVLVDFKRGYYETFGVKIDPKSFYEVDWDKVADTPNFYANLPPMSDAGFLWDFIRPYAPVILTGLPHGVSDAAENKRTWVRKFLGSSVEVITCLSRDKSDFAKPGDVLIDDRIEYRHMWVEKGGVWITHVNARDTINQLRAVGYNP